MEYWNKVIDARSSLLNEMLHFSFGVSKERKLKVRRYKFF